MASAGPVLEADRIAVVQGAPETLGAQTHVQGAAS
jgi:hypothetical protein